MNNIMFQLVVDIVGKIILAQKISSQWMSEIWAYNYVIGQLRTIGQYCLFTETNNILKNKLQKIL